MATELNIPQGLANWFTDFRAAFADMQGTPNAGLYSNWTEEIEANGVASLNRAWMANTPKVRKWVGARIIKNPRLYNQLIGSDLYEGTMELPCGVVDSDPTGLVKNGIQTFLTQTDIYDVAVSTALDSASGAGPTGFDGAALVSASHPNSFSGGNQSNIAAGTALSHASLAAAMAAGMLITQENGQPAGILYDTLRVGPLLMNRAMELTGSHRAVALANDGLEAGTRVAATTIPNTFAGGFLKVIVDPRVTTRYWDLIDTKRSGRPITLLKVRAPEPVSCIAPEDPGVFYNRRYTFGITADLGAVAGHWYSIFRGTGTA